MSGCLSQSIRNGLKARDAGRSAAQAFRVARVQKNGELKSHVQFDYFSNRPMAERRLAELQKLNPKLVYIVVEQ